MAQKICVSKFKDIPFVECDPCRHFYFSRVQSIRLPTGVLIVTLNYDLRTCFEGMAKGPYISTMTLLPGEEIEIEIVRRSKYTSELHEQRSIESEFENSFEQTTRNKFNISGQFNFKSKVEGGFSFLGIGAKASTEFSTSLKTSYERFREVIRSSSASVSRKYDIAIDTKSEVENSFRSLRKFKNPNPCQPVLYLMSQLMKKYKTVLELISVEFDYIPNERKLPMILSQKLEAVAVQRPGRISFNPRTAEVLANTPQKGELPRDESGVGVIRRTESFVRGVSSSVQPNVENLSLEKIDFRQLTSEEVLLGVSADKERAIVAKEIAKISKDKNFRPHIIFTTEHCIRTHDVYVETKVSPCTACTEESVNRENAEIEKIKAEAADIGS